MAIDEELNVKNFLNLWTRVDYVIWGISGFVFAWVGSLLVLLLIILLGHVLNPLFSFVFAGVYIVVILFRNRLIIRIFGKVSHLFFLRFINFVRYPLLILIGLYISIAILVLMDVETTIAITSIEMFLWVFAIWCFFLPLNAMFSQALTFSGRVRIEFEQVFSSLNDFSGRQKWLRKVFKRLSNLLEEGKIDVPYDRLIYHFNLRSMELDSAEDTLGEIERWLLDDHRDDTILRSVREFLPEGEIKPIERIPLRKYFTLIPEEYIKWFVLGIVVIVIAISRPQLLEKILEQIISFIS